jgi:hypothetical protein
MHIKLNVLCVATDGQLQLQMAAKAHLRHLLPVNAPFSHTHATPCIKE